MKISVVVYDWIQFNEPIKSISLTTLIKYSIIAKKTLIR